MPQLLSTKNLLLSHDPLVVGALTTAEQLRASVPSPEDCDVVELRLDSIGLPAEESHALAAKIPLPLLITARHPQEGGHGNLDAAHRAALLEHHLDLAALMDIELLSAPDLQPLIARARARAVGVIGSYHDFHTTPSDDVLRGAVDFGLQFKLDAVKIATTLQSPGDLARLIQLLEKEKRIRLSVMGMGPLGRASRLVLAKCGSLLNYGHLGTSNAPGQWPARQLKQLLKEL